MLLSLPLHDEGNTGDPPQGKGECAGHRFCDVRLGYCALNIPFRGRGAISPLRFARGLPVALQDSYIQRGKEYVLNIEY